MTELAEQMFAAAEDLSQVMLEQFGFANPPLAWPKTGHGTLYEMRLWAWPTEPARRPAGEIGREIQLTQDNSLIAFDH